MHKVSTYVYDSKDGKKAFHSIDLNGNHLNLDIDADFDAIVDLADDYEDLADVIDEIEDDRRMIRRQGLDESLHYAFYTRVRDDGKTYAWMDANEEDSGNADSKKELFYNLDDILRRNQDPDEIHYDVTKICAIDKETGEYVPIDLNSLPRKYKPILKESRILVADLNRDKGQGEVTSDWLSREIANYLMDKYSRKAKNASPYEFDVEEIDDSESLPNGFAEFGLGDVNIETLSVPGMEVKLTDDWLAKNDLDVPAFMDHDICQVFFVNGRYYAFGIDNITDDEEEKNPSRVYYTGNSIDEFVKDFDLLLIDYFDTCYAFEEEDINEPVKDKIDYKIKESKMTVNEKRAYREGYLRGLREASKKDISSKEDVDEIKQEMSYAKKDLRKKYSALSDNALIKKAASQVAKELGYKVSDVLAQFKPSENLSGDVSWTYRPFKESKMKEAVDDGLGIDESYPYDAYRDPKTFVGYLNDYLPSGVFARLRPGAASGFSVRVEDTQAPDDYATFFIDFIYDDEDDDIQAIPSIGDTTDVVYIKPETTWDELGEELDKMIWEK